MLISSWSFVNSAIGKKIKAAEHGVIVSPKCNTNVSNPELQDQGRALSRAITVAR